MENNKYPETLKIELVKMILKENKSKNMPRIWDSQINNVGLDM